MVSNLIKYRTNYFFQVIFIVQRQEGNRKVPSSQDDVLVIPLSANIGTNFASLGRYSLLAD
jgi:hypothetical protein